MKGEAETDFLMKSTNNHGDEAYDDLK